MLEEEGLAAASRRDDMGWAQGRGPNGPGRQPATPQASLSGMCCERWMRHVNPLGLWKPSFTFVTCPRVRDKGIAEALGSPATGKRRKRRLLRQRLSSGQTLGSHTHTRGDVGGAHMCLVL